MIKSSQIRFDSVEGHAREETYDEIALNLAPGTRLRGSGVKVVDVIIEDDLDTTRPNVLLDPFAVFVRIGSVEEHRVRVDDGNFLLGESVLDLASIF